jgi:hypothetical protein
MDFDLATYAAQMDPSQKQLLLAEMLRVKKRGSDSDSLAAAEAKSRQYDPLAAISLMANNPAAAAAAASAQKSAKAFAPDKLGQTGYMLPETGQFIESPLYADERNAQREALSEGRRERLDAQQRENALRRSMEQQRIDETQRYHNLTYGLGLTMAELRRQALGQSATAKEDKIEKINADRLQKFSAVMDKEAIPEFESALTIAEGRLKKHKPGALPGYGRFEGAIPNAMANEEQQMSRTDMMQAANILLKARSGAAVTDNEMRRFLTEVATGAFMSEAALRNGWKNVRQTFNNKKQGVLASVDDDILDRYNERAGFSFTRPAPKGVPQDAWDAMTPEERKKFRP